MVYYNHSASAPVKSSEFLSSLSIALQYATSNSQAIIGARQLNLHRAQPAVDIVILSSKLCRAAMEIDSLHSLSM
jgi:hypothetical protein